MSNENPSSPAPKSIAASETTQIAAAIEPTFRFKGGETIISGVGAAALSVFDLSDLGELGEKAGHVAKKAAIAAGAAVMASAAILGELDVSATMAGTMAGVFGSVFNGRKR